MTLEIEKYVKTYTEKQKENWKHSKKIEIYKDTAQLNEFVAKAKKRENTGKKLYFGIISDETKERLRGQRAVSDSDFEKIPEVIGNPDSVEGGELYMKQPVIRFKRDGMTLVAIITNGALDLYTQTMYISKKNRSLATATDEQASVNTPETTRSTASNNSIHQKIKNTIESFKEMKLYKVMSFCYEI